MKTIKKNIVIIATLLFTVIIMPSINVKASTVSITYRTHIQSIGWQDWKSNGTISGTSGQGLRLEGIQIKTSGDSNLGISYKTHVQSIGWQNSVSDGAISGTTGKSLRLEAIQINLTGSDASKYDIYYRVHIQSYGWLDWAKNGQDAGSVGLSKRLEAIEIKVVDKDSTAPGNVTTPCKYSEPTVSYRTHVQSIGWQGYASNGDIAGTTGKRLRLEAINLRVDSQQYHGGIEYSTHVQKIGWQNSVSDGAMSGTSGKGLRLEAIKIKLTGSLAEKYDIYYRVHAQKFGWMGWAKNYEAAGTAGYAYRLEAIQVKILPKGSFTPSNKINSFIEKVDDNSNNNTDIVTKRGDGTYIKDGKIYFEDIINPLYPDKIGIECEKNEEDYSFNTEEEEKLFNIVNEARVKNGYKAISKDKLSKDGLTLCRWCALDCGLTGCFTWSKLCELYQDGSDLIKGFGYYNRNDIDFNSQSQFFEVRRYNSLEDLEDNFQYIVTGNCNIECVDGIISPPCVVENICFGVAYTKNGYGLCMMASVKKY